MLEKSSAVGTGCDASTVGAVERSGVAKGSGVAINDGVGTGAAEGFICGVGLGTAAGVGVATGVEVGSAIGGVTGLSDAGAEASGVGSAAIADPRNATATQNEQVKIRAGNVSEILIGCSLLVGFGNSRIFCCKFVTTLFPPRGRGNPSSS